MKVYLDTGLFIDYLAPRGHVNSGLRTVGRRGRSLPDIFADADKLLNYFRVGAKHQAATSTLAYYEVEEALYKELVRSAKGVAQAAKLIIPAARAIVPQINMVTDYHKIEVVDLNIETVRAQLRERELEHRGIRAADALHLATAISVGADIFVTTDEHITDLNCILKNVHGTQIQCLDSDETLKILAVDR